MNLRCMAYSQDGIYIAACLDLSLAAQADSLKEAMDKLEAQIKDYFEEVASDPQYANQLIYHRKAPLSMWVKYWSIPVANLIRKIVRSGNAKYVKIDNIFKGHGNATC
ncbi:DUF1902 domain-containing protein [Proteus vulgaris]|nr:DUF1902 domain-containing protein [Proteus vulgaris]QNH66903.1 DUF1902 domain-containing protein [Proteus vulgaris]